MRIDAKYLHSKKVNMFLAKKKKSFFPFNKWIIFLNLRTIQISSIKNINSLEFLNLTNIKYF